MVKKQNVWFARVLIAEELYFYKFPTSFLTYQTDHQLQVKLQIIQAMTTHSLEKKFYVNHFLTQFNVSKQKQANIKKLIAQEFNHKKWIPLIIGQSKLIIFCENLRFKYFV